MNAWRTSSQNGSPSTKLAGMRANGLAEMRDQFATLENHIGDLDTHVGHLDARVVSVEKGLKGLSYKVDQLDGKLDQHRQETKDGFAASTPDRRHITHP